MRSSTISANGSVPIFGSVRLASLTVSFAALLSLLVYIGFTETMALYTDAENVGSNQFSTGTLTLSDDDSATAMFSISGMYPGNTVERCIVVSQTGSIATPGPVRLYGAGYTDSSGGTLPGYMRVTVQEGSGGSFAAGDCTGFTSSSTIVNDLDLATFASSHTNYSNGAGSWTPTTTPESRTYRFVFTLDAAVPSSQQGESITGAAFTWEVQL